MPPEELFRTLLLMRRRGETELETLCAVHFAYKIVPALRFRAARNNPIGEVEDIVGEALEQIIKSSGRPQARFRRGTHGELKAWMFNILDNVVAERYRKVERRGKVLGGMTGDSSVILEPESLDDPEHAGWNPGRDDDSYDEVEEEMLVEEIVAKLNPQHRDVVHLSYERDLPSKEVAEITGLKASNVDKIMSRFYEDLRDALIAAGLEPAAASRRTALRTSADSGEPDSNDDSDSADGHN